jgi:hypothetical protein
MNISVQDYELLKKLEEVAYALYKKGGYSIFIDELNVEIKAANDRGVWHFKFEPKE